MTHLSVITGAAGVIGRATATRFAAEGRTVLMTDVREDALQRAADPLREDAENGRILTVVADISTSSGIEAIARCAADYKPSAMSLINNAATLNRREGTLDLERAEWDRVFETNLHAPVALTRSIVEIMKPLGGGAIVNLSSVSAMICRAGEGPYSISKAAIEALTRNLALELAPYGIRCNAVAPGMLESPFLTKHKDMYAADIEALPLQRAAQPAEIASVINFLVSHDASFVTGTTVNVSGGWRLP